MIPLSHSEGGGSTRNVHAHFDCFSGAAGDMILASCLDAAEDSTAMMHRVQECLRKGLPEIADDFQISLTRVHRGKLASIAALYVKVDSRYGHEPAPVPKASKPVESHDHHHGHVHDHDQTHTYGHSHDHEYSCNRSENTSTTLEEECIGDNHSHSYSYGHSHGHSHSRSIPSSQTSSLRNLPQIRSMLESAPSQYIDPWVRDTSIQVFTELAHAEAMTHGAENCDAVHFHEVGAIDSIVDTVGSLIALHELGVNSVSCSRLPMGEGTCWGMHGLMPVPAPATLRLLEGMPVCEGPAGVTGELVTPTGASLLRVLTKSFRDKCLLPGRPPSFTVRKIGHGAGTKDFERHPNIIRLLLGDDVEGKK
jgi:pyridinium-3,5-bisthiocarboxylic acid mononucleotide nickel chelatase